MHYHFKGVCSSCQSPVEFLSANPYERECVDCQFFNKNVKSQKRRFSNQKELWDFFAGWPDRTLDQRETLHARSIYRRPLRVNASGLGEWLEI